MTKIKKYNVADTIYDNFDYSKSLEFIKTQAKDRKKILDVNCRNGKLLTLLEKEGFDVMGITPSRKHAMLAEKQAGLLVKRKSILKFKTKEKFDVITSLYSACNRYKNYIGIDLALNRMNKCLSDDGIIILELMKTPKKTTSIQNESSTSTIKRKKEKVKVVNTYKLDNKEFKFKNKYKIFDIEKIERIAKKNGLKVDGVFRDYYVKIPDEYGDNIQIVLSKNKEETTKEAKKRKRQFVTKKGKVKTLSRKVYFATMIFMACSGVFVGTLIGDFYNSNFANASSFDYTKEQIETAIAKDNYSAINTSEAPSKYNATLVYMFCENNITNYNVQLKETGALQVMGVNQTIGNLTTIAPSKRTKVAASISSLISTATKTVYDVENNKVFQYSGTPKNLDMNDPEVIKEGQEFLTNWSDPKELSVEDYQKEWGVIPAWISPYVICSETVFEASTFKKETKDGVDLFSATLTLKTKYNSPSSDENRLMAYARYVKQISAMSGVTVTDVESCKITFTIDSTYKLRHVDIEETYNVRYGVIPVTCPSKLSQEYNYF